MFDRICFDHREINRSKMRDFMTLCLCGLCKNLGIRLTETLFVRMRGDNENIHIGEVYLKILPNPLTFENKLIYKSSFI